MLYLPRESRDVTRWSRGGLVWGNEGSYVRRHECSIRGECVLFMFEDEVTVRVLGDNV